VPIFPPLQSAEDFDEAACTGLIRAALGDPAADVAVVGSRTWTMSAQVADRFQVCGPRAAAPWHIFACAHDALELHASMA